MQIPVKNELQFKKRFYTSHQVLQGPSCTSNNFFCTYFTFI